MQRYLNKNKNKTELSQNEFNFCSYMHSEIGYLHKMCVTIFKVQSKQTTGISKWETSISLLCSTKITVRICNKPYDIPVRVDNSIKPILTILALSEHVSENLNVIEFCSSQGTVIRLGISHTSVIYNAYTMSIRILHYIDICNTTEISLIN